MMVESKIDSQLNLLEAAKFRHIKILELLLKNGANVEQTDFEKKTALHIAAEEPYSEGVRLLLQYGADVTAIDSHGNSPVHLAFEKQNYEVIDLLLSVHNVAHSNPANTKGLSHFHIACSRNNINVVKSFIENGVSINICVPSWSDQDKRSYWRGYSPLHIAVAHNRAKIVELLLHSGANVKIKDSIGSIPLHTACQYTLTKMFREYIKDIISNSNKQIDWSSNRKDHLKIINLLINYESGVNCKNNDGYTPIFYAYTYAIYVSEMENDLCCSKTLWTQIIQSLSKELHERRKLILNDLLKLKVNLNSCCKKGSILHRLSLRNGWNDYKTMELFIKAGANVNVTNDEGLTPLHKAVLMEDNIAINVLLDYAANIDCATSTNNSTPLHLAASVNFDIIKILIEKGANVNARKSDGNTVLHDVVDIYCRRMHYEHFNYPMDPFGESPRNHHDVDDIEPPPISIISALIKAGANINSRNSEGFTPLHVACIMNIPVEILFSNLLLFGADINVEDNEGRSVCCYLFERAFDGGYFFHRLFQSCRVLLNHIEKMRFIGLPISKKAFSSCDKIKVTTYVEAAEKKNFIAMCVKEVRALRGTKINDDCTLYNAIFKNENVLSRLVKNPAFKSIIKSKSFNKKYPQYGYLIKLKYQAGLNRIDLLPRANYIFSSLARLDLPEDCSEHICSFFTNGELHEYIHILSSLMNIKTKSSNAK